MARKKLLSEGEIRQFMKLANLRPIGQDRISEMGGVYGSADQPGDRDSDSDEDEDDDEGGPASASAAGWLIAAIVECTQAEAANASTEVVTIGRCGLIADRDDRHV